MLVQYLLLILGFAILLTSGSLLVKASVSIANKLKISPLVSGITIVAIGTSAPELFVSLGAALKGSPDIALGNVIGSNISNISLVLGVTAMVLPLPVIKNTIKFDWVVMFAASLLLFVFAYTGNQIVLWEGVVMILLLSWYLAYSIISSRKSMIAVEVDNKSNYSWSVSLFLMSLASLGLYFGANILVENAQIIARSMGVSERVIGLTIIALGTSLPELSTSVIAAFKKELDISVGNIIGSNLFNILGVLGVTSIIKRINVDVSMLNFDLNIMIGISLILMFLLLFPVRYILQRWNGLVLCLIYLSYIIWVFIA
jgi:cation:H+ antiporter